MPPHGFFLRNKTAVMLSLQFSGLYPGIKWKDFHWGYECTEIAYRMQILIYQINQNNIQLNQYHLNRGVLHEKWKKTLTMWHLLTSESTRNADARLSCWKSPEIIQRLPWRGRTPQIKRHSRSGEYSPGKGDVIVRTVKQPVTARTVTGLSAHQETADITVKLYESLFLFFTDCFSPALQV